MGLREKFFSRREPQPVTLPEILEPEDPVNFDSVLDWAIGLSHADYDKFVECCKIYREANTKAAAALGIKETATSALKKRKLTNKQVDSELDGLLETDPADLKAALANDKKSEERKSKKVKVKMS